MLTRYQLHQPSSRGVRRGVLPGLFGGRLLCQGFSSGAPDYYKTLQIPRTATLLEVKKAFARLAQTYHPDKNSDEKAKEIFKNVAEAYSVLGDAKKREMYDKHGVHEGNQDRANAGGWWGEEATGGGGGAAGQSYGGYDDFFAGAEFGDFFNDWVNMTNMNQTIKGKDILLTLEIGFMESVEGVSKQLAFQRKDSCNVCKGSKCMPGTSEKTCKTCGGTGHEKIRQNNYQMAILCRSCQGKGSSIPNPCRNCRGTGIKNQKHTESITIPKGIKNGQNLKIFEKGHMNDSGSNPGDLIIKVNVKPDNYFKRQDFDIVTDAFLTIPQAVLGDEIEIKTLTGTKSITVPPGVSEGQKARLKGEGVTKLAPNQHQKGDHLVNFRIVIPTKLTEEQRSIYQRLRELDIGKTL